MYHETYLDSIISKISTKINHVALSKLDAIFIVCFITTIIAIVTGIAINLLRY